MTSWAHIWCVSGFVLETGCYRHATHKAQLVRACMVAGRASMRFLDACYWLGSRLVLFIGSSTDSRSSPTAAWCCSCTDHRDQIDSLLACLINADACDAWPACRDSPHAFLVVLFAASNSRVCVPDCFSFFPFSFFPFSEVLSFSFSHPIHHLYVKSLRMAQCFVEWK